MRKLYTLTKENAPKVSTIVNKNNPEWGTKKFNYNDQELNDGKLASTFGCGSNSAMLFEDEYKFWNVVTIKTTSSA